MVQIKVLNKQGIDAAGNKHPAPGIKDGTHECELKWQYYGHKTGGSGPFWLDVEEDEYKLYNSFEDYHSFHKNHRWGETDTRQVWVLAQEKEGKTAEEIIKKEVGFLYAHGIERVKKAMEIYSATKSTRIAELEARVAELERVLKEIDGLSATDKIPFPLYSRLRSIELVATNALKNQQP